MCTLCLAWRVYDDAPVIVAANRDEFYGRPASPPAVHGEDPAFLAPRDEEAGGTWIGVNEHGVFVGVTNRRADLDGGRSRGLLTRDALGAASAAAAVRLVETELAEREYAGCNLVLADADSATVLEWDGVLRRTDLSAGVHVVVNEGIDDAAPKAARILDALGEPPATPDDWREWAAAALRDHDVPVCIHGEDFGTRSSSLVAVAADGSVAYEFVDGHPCETAYGPVDETL